MKKTVLIADGDFLFAKQLSYALEKMGKFQVIDIARNGRQAIRMVRERQPEILVLDLMLTEYDGLSVLELLSPRPITIATSGFWSDYTVDAAKHLGIRCLIGKPCSVETVAESVEAVCKTL